MYHAHSRIVDLLRLIGGLRLTEPLRWLRWPSRGSYAKLHVSNDAAAQDLGQFRQNLKAQVEEILLPDGVFHFHDQRIPHQRLRRCVRGDAFADSSRPSRPSQLFGRDGVGDFQSCEGFASAFHADEFNSSTQRAAWGANINADGTF